MRVAHSEFLLQIADEFKIVVIDAIQSLCVKYPQKHSVLLNFLSVSLREVRHRCRGGECALSCASGRVKRLIALQVSKMSFL